MASRAKPPVSYDDDLAVPGPALAPSQPAERAKTAETGGEGRRPILDRSAPTLLYLHPAGKHQLRQYAVSQGLKTKVHDLLIEALEEWGARRGLVGPWRVEPTKPRQ